MGQLLAAPISSKYVERHGTKALKVASIAMQGYRIEMEDAHTIQLKLSDRHPNISFFAVFDGHGGDKASRFMAQRLYQEVAKLDKPTDRAALIKVIGDLDKEFCAKADADGTTCLFAIVEAKKKPKKKGTKKKGKRRRQSVAGQKPSSWNVLIGNIGDSRAIVIKSDGKLHSLTSDHKPEAAEEEKRIKEAGGFVHANRVDGQLAMSRAIGDRQYKTNISLPPEKQKVIALPDFTEIECKAGDALLLYCDGIVEQMQNEDVSEFFHAQWKDSKDKDPAPILSELCTLSLDKGSKDNMSIMAIMFEDGSSFGAEPEFLPGPYSPYSGDSTFCNAYLADAKKYGYEGDRLREMISKAEEKMPPIAPRRPEPQDQMFQSLLQSLAGQYADGEDEAAMAERAHFLFESMQGAQISVVEDEDGEGEVVSMSAQEHVYMRSRGVSSVSEVEDGDEVEQNEEEEEEEERSARGKIQAEDAEEEEEGGEID